jgi:hypothetical protein
MQGIYRACPVKDVELFFSIEYSVPLSRSKEARNEKYKT